MSCHLIETENFSSRNELNLQHIEDFEESCHFELYLCQCTQCQQLYIGCYVEVWDDSWNFWVPVTEEEVGLVRNNHEKATELVHSRRHLVYSPSGEVYWNEGKENALIFGPHGF